MPRRRTNMRRIRETIQLHFENGLSTNRIASSLGIARSVVQECIRRARHEKLQWPLPEDLDDTALERLLYPRPKATRKAVEPDWEYIHRELRRNGVTRELLWTEYTQRVENSYSYQQFCRLYRRWEKRLNLVMRQDHRAGEKLFVDFAGATLPVTNPETGEVTDAQLFVAVLGASNYTYAEACSSQSIDSWIAAHIRTFEYMKGVPEILIPDNLKAAVTKPHRYEPELNERYHQMASHYRTSIMPARVRKPRDKAPAEKGVQLVERWIVAVLRNRTFFSLAELNASIAELLESLNSRSFKKLEGSRKSWFEQIDKPALKELPQTRFEDARWLRARVGNDYHVRVDGHYYSVPHQLAFEEVEIRATATTIEVLYAGKRVASHKRDPRPNKHSTKREHRPKSHQFMNDWNEERVTNWARQVGPAASHLVEQILRRSRHSQIGVRTCLGLLSLHEDYGAQRLEAACRRAAVAGSWSVSSLRSMLKHGLDRQVLQLVIPNLNQSTHSNIRGAEYYKDSSQEN
ncbi:MAG: IS21 family transposase [Ktedonobacteraceae bacterium]